MRKSFIEPHAVGSSKLSDRFFAVVERIYSFFSASTHRYRPFLWNTYPLSTALKRVIDTRWSAHYASVKALDVGIDGVVDPLNAICDSNEDLDTHGDAHGIFILDAIQSFAFFIS